MVNTMKGVKRLIEYRLHKKCNMQQPTYMYMYSMEVTREFRKVEIRTKKFVIEKEKVRNSKNEERLSKECKMR